MNVNDTKAGSNKTSNAINRWEIPHEDYLVNHEIKYVYIFHLKLYITSQTVVQTYLETIEPTTRVAEQSNYLHSHQSN